MLLFAIQSNAQTILKDSSIRLYQDSLPPLKIKKSTGLTFLAIYSGAFIFGATANQYYVRNKKSLSNLSFKPYLFATEDDAVIDSYNTHRNLRPIYFTITAIGGMMYVVGMGQSYANSFGLIFSFGSYYKKYENATTFLIGGAGIIIAGAITRIISFSNLHKSVNRYNQLRKPINLGASSSGIGLGLTVSF